MTARILIIEDEALVAMELRYVLEDLGHEVVGMAADARTARNLARAVQTAVDYALRRRTGQPVEYAPPGLQLFG
jgi:DNA-binding NarL/FixJ family response regulator